MTIVLRKIMILVWGCFRLFESQGAATPVYYINDSVYSFAIQTSGDSTPSKKVASNDRIWLVTSANVALWAGSYIALNQAWYRDYPRSSFRFFDDMDEWNQMDKAGHIWSTYQVSRVSAEAWKWAGLNNRKSAWLGGISSLAYQSIIEIQDGFSTEWGFSWSDMGADVLGAGIFIAQEYAWSEQRIQIKFSSWRHDYPNDLLHRRDQLFGTEAMARLLKDYNAQTYWLSGNIRSFIPDLDIPGWLNISVGYGATGLLGGTENIWTDKSGNSHDRTDIKRERNFYISPDIDFTRIRTRSKFLRSVLFVLNSIKVPAPTLELRNGKARFHAVYF
jgi:hypothetical protein